MSWYGEYRGTKWTTCPDCGERIVTYSGGWTTCKKCGRKIKT